MNTIFFDLGNVLLFFSFPRMFEQMSRVLDIPSHQLHNEILHNGIGLDFERGKISRTEFHEHLCRLANKSVDREMLFEALANIFTPNWPMVNLLKQLKTKGHRLLLLSNTNEVHFSYAKKHYKEMFDPFDDFILSYEVGHAKPEPEIYLAALKKTFSEASHCFYTDDIPEFVEAATRVNIPSMVFTGIDPLRDELRSRGYL